MMLETIIPAIKASFPGKDRGYDVIIQMDNAKPHVGLNDDKDIIAALTTKPWNMEIKYQPPQSPECNILDLGILFCIQKEQQKHTCRTLTDLLVLVKNSYDAITPLTLRRCFLSLKYVIIKILEHEGGNRFKIPHVGKLKYWNKFQTLPTTVECTELALYNIIYKDVIKFLHKEKIRVKSSKKPIHMKPRSERHHKERQRLVDAGIKIMKRREKKKTNDQNKSTNDQNKSTNDQNKSTND